MHIIVTSWGYPTNTEKGNPFVKELAEGLRNHGNKVTVFLVSFYNPITRLTYGRKTNWQRSSGIEIIDCKCVNLFSGLPVPRKLKTSLLQWQALRCFKKYMAKNGRPDLIQQHYILNTYPHIIRYLAKKTGTPYVLIEHSPGLRTPSINLKLKGLMSEHEVISYVRAALLRFARSPQYKHIYESVFQVPFELLPSMVLNQDIKNKRVQPDGKDFIFLSVGSLLPGKAIDRLIRAFSIAFKDKENVKLRIVGKGECYNELKQLVQQEGQESRISFLGLLSKQEVFRQIDRSHVLVVSSDYETFGNTLIEAMARGVPVVSTKCGGPETIVTDKTGYLAEKDDHDLAEKMKAAYGNYARFIPEEIIRELRSRFSEEVVVGQLVKKYQTLLQKEKGKS